MTATERAQAPVWLPAISLLDDITRRTEAGAVVRAAYRAGLLERLCSPASVTELASMVTVEETRLVAVLEVLRSLGVASAEAGTWTLTPAWEAVAVGEVRTELEAAGFVDTRVDDMTFVRLVRGRRPQ